MVLPTGRREVPSDTSFPDPGEDDDRDLDVVGHQQMRHTTDPQKHEYEEYERRSNRARLAFWLLPHR